MTITFGGWLKAQRHRSDAVGDLARDFIADLADRRRVACVTPSLLRDRLLVLGACSEAFDALAAADDEWNAVP